jgi:5-methylcytosine-specific restriction endonuclease McrA
MAKKNHTKLSEWQQQAKLGGECAKCRQLSNNLTVDHVIPVSILDMLDETGEAKYEWESNYELICRVCNVFKANRLDKRNPKTVKLLKELLTF